MSKSRKQKGAIQGRVDVSIEDRIDPDDREVFEQKEETHILEARKIAEDEHSVTIGLSLGVTKNLGDYEYARIDVTVSGPCASTDADDYFERMKKWASTKIKKEITKINSRFADRGDLD